MAENPSIDAQANRAHSAPGTLLAAKLAVPPLRADRVSRPRLARALDAGLLRKLTVVSAPAGYGKTTLLSTWASASEVPVAWVTLDEEGLDLSRFLTYLVTALRAADADLGSSTLDLLQYQPLASVEQLVIPLINDLSAVATDLVVVLDDYHFVDAQPVHDAVAFLLDNLPPRLHMVISARSDAPLPVASLRGAGQLNELRAADLGFSPEEASAFLRTAMGIELSEKAVAKLNDRVEGWAVGLQLAGLVLREQQDPEAFIDEFSGTHRYVVDFLTDEVMLHQPKAIREFLLETSILDSLTPELCDAVTARQDGGDLLSELESSNLFVIALDDRREWYRYHRLFRDTLKYRLAQQADQGSVRELHRRAAAWYGQHDFKDQALQHWMTAEDYAEAANLIEQAGHAMLASAQLNKLRRWIDALPPALVRERPWLSIQSAWMLNLTGSLEDMELRLQDAERALPKEDKRLAGAIKGNIATIRAGAARKRHRSRAAIEYLEEALAYLPRDDALVRSSAHFNLGSTLLDIGEVEHAERELNAALQGAGRTDHVYTLIAGRSYLADCYTLQGQMRRAARTYLQAVDEGLARNRGKPLPLAGYAHSGLGRVLYEQNLLDEAEHHLNLALVLGEQLADRTVLRRALPTLARLQQARGHMAAAQASWEEAFDLAQQYGDRFGVDYLEAYRARMWLEQNARRAAPAALASAERWAAAYRDRPRDGLEYREAFAQLTLAWLEFLQGEPRQACSRLEQLEQAARAGRRIDCLITILACMALTHQNRGRSDAAHTALKQAIELAAPEGYRRTFVDFGEPMRKLLQGVDARDSTLEYVQSLLMIFSAEARATAAGPLPEPLTKRELEVLKLLAAGYSNQDIAEELVLAVGTVKQYNHVIYRKLEVHTRREAAERARDLKLL